MLRIYDETRLVTAGQSTAWSRPEFGASEYAIAFPDMPEIEIGWTGGACEHNPTLHVAGGPGQLLLTIANPVDPNWVPFLPIGCPAVGIPLALRLTMSEPVEQDALRLEVHWR
jgi:hypothetical protein